MPESGLSLADKRNTGQNYPTFAAHCFLSGFACWFLLEARSGLKGNDFWRNLRINPTAALRHSLRCWPLPAAGFGLFFSSLIPPLAAILFYDKFEKTTANDPLLAIPALFVGAGLGIAHMEFKNRFYPSRTGGGINGAAMAKPFVKLYCSTFGFAGGVLPIACAAYQQIQYRHH